MPLINVNKLVFSWPGASEPTLAVDDFRVNAGEAVFLQGASGSGKSTLLSLLAGTLVAQTGSVQILDTDLQSLSARKRDQFRARHIGIVFQQFNLLPFLTVAGNLRLASRFAGRPDRDILTRGTELLEALRLERDLLDRQADQLSVGQQQRIAIARAVINEPELLIADEPTSALDSDARDNFIKLLMSVRQITGCTIVFASHDQDLASFFDRKIKLTDINTAAGVTSSNV